MPGGSLANAASSTDGSSVRDDGPLGRHEYPTTNHDVTAWKPILPCCSAELANHPDYELIKELALNFALWQGGANRVNASVLGQIRPMDRRGLY